MTSFINTIDIATLLLKSSHKKQPSVIRLLWAKDLAQMPFSLRCVQYMVTSTLQDQQYMFGVKSLLMVEKALLVRKNLVAVLFRRLMQQSQRSIFPHAVKPAYDGINVYMNLDDTLKNETLMSDV